VKKSKKKLKRESMKVHMVHMYVASKPFLLILSTPSRGVRAGLHGCQIKYFYTKNPKFGKFWRA
jgi:hypothetical protein